MVDARYRSDSCMPLQSHIHARLVSGKARIHRQWKVLFPPTSVATCKILTRLESRIDAHTFVRLQEGRLLLLSNGGRTQEVGRETSTCHERRCPYTNTDKEVQQEDDSDNTWKAALARCFRAYPVQALHPSLQVPTWHSTKMHDGSMLACFCNRWMHSPALSGERTVDVPCPKLSTYGRRAFSYPGLSAWNSLPNYIKNSRLTLVMFKRSLKSFFFQSISTLSASEMFAC